jgi:hypothetical protein
LEDRVQQAIEIKLGELAALGRRLNSGHGGGHHSQRCGFWVATFTGADENTGALFFLKF